MSQQEAIARIETREKNRGRIEHRIASIFPPNEYLTKKWATINKVITIRRIRTQKGKTTDQLHYYVSSLRSNDPNLYLDLIRKHWWVENKLHYVKDVIMQEDRTRFATFDRVKKNGLFRNIAFNCIKLNGFKSIKYTLEKCAANIELIIKLIRT